METTIKTVMKFVSVVLALTTANIAAAQEVGDDGLHVADWIHTTFLDLREDLAEANAEGKRLALIIEQRGCIYCSKMHEDVYPVPEIDAMLRDDFFVVRINMFGDLEVTDFDGEVMTEKEAMQKWGVMFTPTFFFFPQEVTEDVPANQAAIAYVPGALSPCMFHNMLTFVTTESYLEDDNFQKYHADIFNAGEGICGRS